MVIRFGGCYEDSFYGVPLGRYGDLFRGMTDIRFLSLRRLIHGSTICIMP